MADCKQYMFVYTTESIARQPSCIHMYCIYVRTVHEATSLQETSLVLTEIVTSQRTSIQPSSSDNVHLLSLDESEIKVCMYVYIHVYVMCTYVCTLFVCVFCSVCVHTISHTYKHKHTHTYKHARTYNKHMQQVCTLIHTYTHHPQTCVCIDTRTYIIMYIRMYTECHQCQISSDDVIRDDSK